MSRQATHTNLVQLLAREGADAAVDLRGDAYGVGASEVAALAKDAGFLWARYTPHHTTPSALPEAPPSQLLAEGWWDGPSGNIAHFEADIISLKRVPPGSAVSYGYHYETSRETTLVLVSAGFADGLPRTASGRAQVLVSGERYPIAGRIAMDQCVVDVGDAEVSLGDRVTLWGNNPTLGDWAKWSERPASSLLPRVGPRVVKTWV